MRVMRMKVTRAEFIVGIKVDRRVKCFNPILCTRAVAALFGIESSLTPSMTYHEKMTSP
jgi:hypothetical protein